MLMHADVQRAHDALAAATAGLDAAALAAGPPGKWTVAQIVEHLSKGYAGTAHVLGRCLDQDQPKARAVTVKDRLLTFVVVDLGHLPEGRHAPDVTRPADAPPRDVVERALAALRDLDEVAARAESRFGARTPLVNHPIIGPLGVDRWRRFHWIHTRHHLKQIAARLARGSAGGAPRPTG